MEDDYLATDFDAAEKKLNTAINDCGTSGCAPKVKAKLYMALGVVLIGGKAKKEDGKQAFADGLKLDASAAPEADYITSDIKAAFEEAKKGGGSGGGGVAAAVAQRREPNADGMTLLAVPQQRVNTPIPIYITLDDSAAKKVASITLTFTGPSGGKKELELEKSGKGYRVNIPCTSVKKQGTVRMWVIAKDKSGNESLTLGSNNSPILTEIVADLADKPPSWPGFAPPEQCEGGGGGGGGDEPVGDDSGSSKRQCVDDDDCPADEKCAGNVCLKKVADSGTPNGESSSDEDSKGAKLADSPELRPGFAMILVTTYGLPGCAANAPGDAFSDSRLREERRRTRVATSASPLSARATTSTSAGVAMRLMALRPGAHQRPHDRRVSGHQRHQ
jgi:hypothetical protein